MKIPRKYRLIFDPLLVKARILYKINLFFILFLVLSFGCQNHTSPLQALTKDERRDLYYLLHQIIDDESGAYVLFGSKPLCTAFLSSTSKSNIYWRDPEHGWSAWEKIKKTSSMTRYVLLKKPLTIEVLDEGTTRSLHLHFFVFADVIKTALVLTENYDFFKSFTGMDFHPLNITFEIEDSDSLFWNRIFGFNNQYSSIEQRKDANIALGLLFGFGKKNAFLFNCKSEIEQLGEKSIELLNHIAFHGTLDQFGKSSVLWAQIFQEQGLNTFLIPGFVVAEDDIIIEEYKKERVKIQKLYQGRDFLEVTLEQLCKPTIPKQ